MYLAARRSQHWQGINALAEACQSKEKNKAHITTLVTALTALVTCVGSASGNADALGVKGTES